MVEHIFRSENDSRSLTRGIEDMCALMPDDWSTSTSTSRQEPTLVQREEIVCCRDCDSASFDEFGGGWCIENCREIKAWYFCAWARKKGSLENGI